MIQQKTEDSLLSELIQSYKDHFLGIPLTKNGADELYKWQLITVSKEKSPLQILHDHCKNPSKPEMGGFVNLIDAQRDNKTLKYLLENKREQMSAVLGRLADENTPLAQRLADYKVSVAQLLPSAGYGSKANDERTAAAFLACFNPEKYTFYKDEIYRNYCRYIGEEPKQAGEKYPHYLQLLEPLAQAIRQDKALSEKIQTETQGLVQSDLLNAQNVLWQMKDLMIKKDDKYSHFKHLLEYFVSHLEWCENKNPSFIGYNNYIKPLLDTKKFKYSGQGWNGNQIQEQIEQWAHYENYRICINIYGANYQSNACYLNWEGTWLNVRPLWDNGHIVKVYLSKEEKSSAKEENTKTIKELGLFDNKEPNSIIKTFFDEYEKMILEFNGLYYKKLMMAQIKDYTQILSLKKNLILQGAPGTGKTYNTRPLALAICGEPVPEKHDDVMERYDELRKKGRIGFVTFHQSMDYEDFVEGIKPKTENGTITYEVEDGIFKKISDRARENDDKNHVLIIDEINRGNVSKIFGELITLLEADKRIGGAHPIKVTLPYSKEEFGVPSNLYIIGTMNTTDRSVGNIDYAVRRRFAFVTLKADRQILVGKYGEDSKQVQLFDKISDFLNDDKKHVDMDFEDLMVGHSYFMADDAEELKLKLEYEIIPLIEEYQKYGIINVKKEELEKEFENWKGIIEA